MSITNLNVVRSFYKGKPCIVGLSCAVYFSNTDTRDIYYVYHKKDFKDLNYKDKKTTIKGFKDQESEIYWYNKSKKCIDTLKEILPKYKRISYISCSPSKDELDFFKEHSEIDVTVIETNETSKKELDSYDDIPKNIKILHYELYMKNLGKGYTNGHYLMNLHYLNLKTGYVFQDFSKDMIYDCKFDIMHPKELLNQFYENIVCNTKDVAEYLKKHTEYVLKNLPKKYSLVSQEKIDNMQELIKTYKTFKLNEYKGIIYELSLYEHGNLLKQMTQHKAQEQNYDFIMYLTPGTSHGTLRTACCDLNASYFFKLLKEKNINIVGSGDYYYIDIFIEDNLFNEYVSNNLLV